MRYSSSVYCSKFRPPRQWVASFMLPSWRNTVAGGCARSKSTLIGGGGQRVGVHTEGAPGRRGTVGGGRRAAGRGGARPPGADQPGGAGGGGGGRGRGLLRRRVGEGAGREAPRHQRTPSHTSPGVSVRSHPANLRAADRCRQRRARRRRQRSGAPSGTSRSGCTSTTSPSSTMTPSVSTSEK